MPIIDMRVRIPVPLTTEYIATGAITTDRLADESITTNKLADLAVTLSKLHAVSRTSHFIGDDTEVSTTSTDWEAVKRFRFTKSSRFDWEHLWFVGQIKNSVSGSTTTLGIFINEETDPRGTISTTKGEYDLVDTDFDISDLPYGVHAVTLKMKATTGTTAYCKTTEFYLTRRPA